jgi:hypothetical protein
VPGPGNQAKHAAPKSASQLKADSPYRIGATNTRRSEVG